MRVVNEFNADEKILHNTDKLDYFFNGHKTLIVTELDLTNRCNNRCPACCGNKNNQAELTKEQIKLIIDGLCQMRNKGVILSGGGEPLISPHFIYTMNALRNKMKIGVNSNGLALTEENATVIAESSSFFRISLDAATPDTYAITHGMGRKEFDRVIKNCRMFADIRDKTNSQTSFGLGFLTNRETVDEMEAFVCLAKDCGADFAQFRPMMGTEINPLDITKIYLKLADKYNADYFRVTASIQKYREMGNSGQRDYSRCRGMFFSTVITADAKVFACIHHRQNPEYFIGQINEDTTLEDIFLSPRIREVYKSIQCEKCPVLCRNDSFNRTLDNLSKDINHLEFL